MKASHFRLPRPIMGAFAALGMMIPGLASAQCCAPPTPPVSCCTAPPTCCAPPPAPDVPPGLPGIPNPGGGGGGYVPSHTIIIPGVNVSVAPSIIVNNVVTNQVTATASGNASGSGMSNVVVYGGGGGGGGYLSPPSQTGSIGGLNVEGVRRASGGASGSRSYYRQTTVQAYCIDDLNVPHPASQVFRERDVATGYDGELFRCIAGSRMQYVLSEGSGLTDCLVSASGPGPMAPGSGHMGSGAVPGPAGATASGCRMMTAGSGCMAQGGSASGPGGALMPGSSTGGCRPAQTITCAKGDALYYSPAPGAGGAAGQGGQLSCRPQIPARDCNERSLLRRYGAGYKVLTMLVTERYQSSYREESYQSGSGGMALSLDGGVGGVMY